MTQLSQLIDLAPDDSGSITSILLRLKIVASRIKATEIVQWVNKELEGYSNDDELPKYRAHRSFPARGLWANPVRTLDNAELSTMGLEDRVREALFGTSFRQPVKELEKFSEGEGAARISWDPQDITIYLSQVQMKMEYMELISAATHIPVGTFQGIISNIRSKVIDLALELESIDPELGETSIGTDMEEKVNQVVQNFTFNVYGTGNNIGAGKEFTQNLTVKVNDVSSLITAAGKLGLTEEELQELQDAILDEPQKQGTKVTRFIERVKTGVVGLGLNVSAEVAASQITQLINAYYGAG
ncbi:AbiTii domain-containing protein [Glutamicibacter halophytocola]|uniref:AbiTii domain-containing protein n=1 Tax=Glutamicibacter halophytocola TaxID=1933880 RepID=UPI0015C52974|nr:hypothetical protein [Glutamicibacter halophytocola]NQD42797.1 hypothetical protein [Glutamicibacter halophytocola]